MENPFLKLKTYTKIAGLQATALKVVHYSDELISEHTHDFFELVAVYKGDGVHIVDDNCIPVYPNELFLIFPGQKHHYEKYSHLSLLTFMFDPAVLSPYLAEFNRFESFRNFFDPARDIKRLYFIDELTMSKLDNIVFRITEEQVDMQPGVSMMQTTLLFEALILICRKCFNISEEEAGFSNKLAPVISYMEKNFHSKLTLENLAIVAGMSVSNFCRFFKKHMNISPINYLLNLRIKNAKALLSQSSLSISEIAEKTGFNDANYFSRQFVHITGIQPNAYRKQDHGILHTPGLDLKNKSNFVLKPS